MKIVRTFATSANLGPGFDCLGICFDLYNEYEFFLSDKYTIEGFSEKFSNPSDNLIVKSYEKVFFDSCRNSFDMFDFLPRRRKRGSEAEARK